MSALIVVPRTIATTLAVDAFADFDCHRGGRRLLPISSGIGIDFASAGSFVTSALWSAEHRG
jgi:hypothetical protein